MLTGKSFPAGKIALGLLLLIPIVYLSPAGRSTSTCRRWGAFGLRAGWWCSPSSWR